MKQHILLSEHQVASASEIKQLLLDGDITEFVPRGARHKLFWNIKIAPYASYKGPWGNELIYWDGVNAAVVKSTESRSHEIRQHISDCLFG
jgi:hypothetical protein